LPVLACSFLTARHYYNLCFRHNRASTKCSPRQPAARSVAAVPANTRQDLRRERIRSTNENCRRSGYVVEKLARIGAPSEKRPVMDRQT
jgi:hypothetical protein